MTANRSSKSSAANQVVGVQVFEVEPVAILLVALHPLDDPVLDIVGRLRVGRRAALRAAFRAMPSELHLGSEKVSIELEEDVRAGAVVVRRPAHEIEEPPDRRLLL